MEALLTTSTGRRWRSTRYDQLGHLLRVVALRRTRCSACQTGPVDESNKDLFAKCNSWLGPNQPGVTSPTRPTTARTRPRELRARCGKPAKRAGERRGEGQPEAGPLPGQTDPSKPQIVLPPAVQELLDTAAAAAQRQRLKTHPDAAPA